jgi:hypothetical protein
MASQGPPAIPRPYIVTSTSKALLAAKAFGHFVSGLKSDAPPLTGKPARRLFDQLYE